MNTTLYRSVSLLALLALWALPAAAQPAIPTTPTARLFARAGAHAAQAQASFAVKSYQVQLLDTSEEPAVYSTFYEGNRSYENGRVSEEIFRSPDFTGETPGLQNQSRITYTYENDRLSQQVFWSWDGSAWVENDRTTYTYDGTGQNTVTLFETWVDSTSSWRNDSRSTMTFSGGVPSEFLDEDWNGTAWVPTDRSVISEENGDGVLVDQTWDGTAWVNDYRTIYTLPVEEIWQLQRAYGDLLSFGFFTFVPDRAAAAAFYALEYTEQSWDGAAWVNDNRTRITSSTATSIQAVEDAWDSVGSGWVVTDRVTLSFTGNRLDEMLMEEAPDGTLVPSSKTTYTYDGNGNPELLESFGDEDGDGTLDTQANMRTLIDWVDLTGTAVDGETPLARTTLTGVQPNPASATADVAFFLATAGPVRLQVFDVLGREVTTVVDATLAAGPHTIRFDATSLTAGLYFVRLEANGTSGARALVVAR